MGTVNDLDAETEGKIEAEAPTLAAARYITISKNGRLALISFEDETCPELWRLRDMAGTVQLLFRGRFTLPEPETHGHDVSAKASIYGKAQFW